MESKLDKFLKKTAVRYFYIITIISIANTFYFWYENIEPFNYIVTVIMIVNTFLLFIPRRIEYQVLRPFILLYLIIFIIILYPIVIIFWKNGQITPFLYYLLTPLGALLFLSFKTFIKLCIAVFFVTISVFILAQAIDIPVTFSDTPIITSNILTIISFLIIMIFYLYSLNRKSYFALLDLREKEDIEKKQSNAQKRFDTEKFKKIYDTIIHYFEKEKPYCDPDFSMAKLSRAINYHPIYITKAIKANQNVSFNVFVNTYKIRMVKEMLDKDLQNKYTMKYIYLSCGFKHQSTFNKVFKEIEGITPSEYIKHKATWVKTSTSSMEE
ncbi:MAG TPA: hypothetical protein DIT04_12535 [Dysgonomonas sp.]|nr:hypothetical protein [Dysgonomonas sp.]